MLKEASHKLTGNDRFEGFGIDLIHELSVMSGFKYEFHVQEDKSSGNPDKTGKWSGMIGEVLAEVSINTCFNYYYGHLLNALFTSQIHITLQKKAALLFFMSRKEIW